MEISVESAQTDEGFWGTCSDNETAPEDASSIWTAFESNAMFEIVFEDWILATESPGDIAIGSGTALVPMLMFEDAHAKGRPGGVLGRWQPFTAFRMRHCEVAKTVVPVTVFVVVIVDVPDT